MLWDMIPRLEIVELQAMSPTPLMSWRALWSGAHGHVDDLHSVRRLC